MDNKLLEEIKIMVQKNIDELRFGPVEEDFRKDYFVTAWLIETIISCYYKCRYTKVN